MTKAEIVAQISRQSGIEKTVVMTVIESFMENVKESMVAGNEVFLRGFGSFIIKRRAEKTARNISKNTTIKIPAHNIPAFKPAKAFLNAVKENMLSINLQMVQQHRNYKKKSDPKAAFVVIRQGLFLAFFRWFGRLFRSFLLLDGRIELDGDHHDTVVFHTALVAPFFGLEIPLDGQHRTLGQLVERPGVLVFTPRLKIHKGGNAFGFLAIILQSAYCQRETCYTCVGELTDFCILSYETGYYEIVFNLFHNELFLEVIKSILRCLKK